MTATLLAPSVPHTVTALLATDSTDCGGGTDGTEDAGPEAALWNALGGLAETIPAAEFEFATEGVVFGRDFGDWQHVGSTDSDGENLHLYRHRDTPEGSEDGAGRWALLPISTGTMMAIDPEHPLGNMSTFSFTAAYPQGRRSMLPFLPACLVFGSSFADLLGIEVDGYRACADFNLMEQVQHALRVEFLGGFAESADDEALVWLSALQVNTAEVCAALDTLRFPFGRDC